MADCRHHPNPNQFTQVNSTQPMKKIIIILSLFTAFACKKEGYMYRATYTTPNGWLNGNHTQKSYATNFFYVDINDSAYAMQWYMKTDAYANAMRKGADSLWIEYHCTLEEWRDKE